MIEYESPFLFGVVGQFESYNSCCVLNSSIALPVVLCVQQLPLALTENQKNKHGSGLNMFKFSAKIISNKISHHYQVANLNFSKSKQLIACGKKGVNDMRQKGGWGMVQKPFCHLKPTARLTHIIM